MSRFKRVVLWIGLALIILLIFLSIYGAFIGAERAKSFFNSLPLSVYWIALILLLIVGILVFRRLVHIPGLLFIHAGCILILTGAVCGSQAGHKLQKKSFGIDKIPVGQMAIFEGESENRVALENDDEVRELPFYVKLKDFRIEYYKPEYLYIQNRQGKSWKIPAELNAKFSLGDNISTVRIVRKFENFKIKIEGDNRVPYDDPQPGSNAALEVEIKSPGGQVVTKYFFERFPGHIHPEDNFFLSYRRVISEYISELQIIRNNEVVAEKDIEVNHPLHFGGYHLYQADYDKQAGQYTILTVTSDTGLGTVYAGYLMLCIGLFWHFWLRHIFKAKKADGD
jgi:cytochrome c biogenesis protein ResB